MPSTASSRFAASAWVTPRECWPQLTLGMARPVASRARRTSSWSRWLCGSMPSKPAALAAWNFSRTVLPGEEAYQMPFFRSRFTGGSGGQYLGEAVGEVFESFRGVAAGLFGHHPAVVADVVHGLHDGRPIVIAFEQLNVEALPQAFGVALLAAEFLDMELLDAWPEDANPLLGPAVVDDVADIEMPANRGAFEFVHVTGGFQRAEQEAIPHVLAGDLDAQLFRQGDGFADFRLGACVGGIVGDVLVDHGGHEQHRGGAITFGVTQGLLETFEAFRSDLRIGVGQRLCPMVPPTDAGNGQAGGVARAQHFVLVHVAHHLRALEAGLLDGPHLLQDGAFDADRGPHDALLDGSLRSGGFRAFLFSGKRVRGQRRQCEGAGAGFQEFTTMHRTRGMGRI